MEELEPGMCSSSPHPLATVGRLMYDLPSLVVCNSIHASDFHTVQSTVACY